MCDFAVFRNKANATFSDLIVSVMMFEEGKGKSVPVTMYRVKVAGMAIGDSLTSQAASVEDVLKELVRRVGAARRAKKEAHTARQLARRAAAVQPVIVPVMVAQAGESRTQPVQVPQEMAIAA